MRRIGWVPGVPRDDRFQDITVEGNVSLAATTKVEGDLDPDTDDNRDLGDATHRWRNLFLASTLNATGFRADSITLDITNADVVLSRDAANVLGLAAGDALALDEIRLDRANKDVILSRDSANKLKLASGDSFQLDEISAVGNINDILFVDGVKYAQTLAGVQAAHDALPSTGGIIFLPSSVTYDGSTTLTISKDDVQLIGAGRNTAILRQTGTTASVVKVTGQRVRLENLSIRYSAAADAGVAALHVQDAGRGVYRNIHIDTNIRIGMLVEATAGASAEHVVRNYFDLINVPGCTDNGIVFTGGSATRRVIDQNLQRI